MYRRRMYLVLALVFVLAVVVNRYGRSSDAGDAIDPETRSRAQAPEGRPGPYRGLVAASWRESGPTVVAESEDENEFWSDETPPGSDSDLARRSDIPEEVRARLAEEYVGLDIAVARPPQGEKGPVRE